MTVPLVSSSVARECRNLCGLANLSGGVGFLLIHHNASLQAGRQHLGESLEPVRADDQVILVRLTLLRVHDIAPRGAIDDRFVRIDNDIDTRLLRRGR